MSTSTLIAGPCQIWEGRSWPRFPFPRQPEPTDRFRTTKLLRPWLKP